MQQLLYRPKVSVFIATSLDGFIARKDGSIHWLDEANATVPEGEDCGYHDFFNSVDTLLMGRKTFEKVLSFEAWPYGDTRVVVLSTQLKEVPSRLAKTVSIANSSPLNVLQDLAARGSKHVYLDGGRAIQSFFLENLVDEMTLTTIPILLGDGISLFGKIRNDVSLSHVKTHAYKNGFVQTKYRVRIDIP